jgi:hypothetical protein
LELITRYVRNQFTDPNPGATATAIANKTKQRSSAAMEALGLTNINHQQHSQQQGAHGAMMMNVGPNVIKKKRKVVKKAFYSDEEDETIEEEITVSEPNRPEMNFSTHASSAALPPHLLNNSMDAAHQDLDHDHSLILKSSLPLLKSRNSGVVLGVCTLHYYCGNQSETVMKQIGKALVRISRNQREVTYIVLHSINIMARDRPEMFRPFLSDFFVKATDPTFNR